MTRRNQFPTLLHNVPALRPLRPLRRPRRRRRRRRRLIPRLLPQPVSHLRGSFGEATVNCSIEKGQQAQRRNDNLNDRATTTTPQLPNHAARRTQVRKSHGQTHAERSELLSTSAPRRGQTCVRGSHGAFWGSLPGENAYGAKRCFTPPRKHMRERSESGSHDKCYDVRFLLQSIAQSAALPLVCVCVCCAVGSPIRLGVEKRAERHR